MKTNIKIRQRFGDWQVIDSTIEIGKRSHKFVLCYDHIADEIEYVRVFSLLNRTSTKHKSRRGNKRGYSTRYLYLHLPKYVYKFTNPNSIKKFRVCIKRKPKGHKTLGYFNTIKEASVFIRKNLKLFINLEK